MHPMCRENCEHPRAETGLTKYQFKESEVMVGIKLLLWAIFQKKYQVSLKKQRSGMLYVHLFYGQNLCTLSLYR